MTCQIEVTSHADYLHVIVSGENTLQTLQTYTRETSEARRRLKQPRVLVVVELTGPDLSMLNVYQGVRDGSENAAGIGMKVAYVDENRSHG